MYRADIDGLRAIAVLGVVGYHAFPGLVPSGFVGVDVFFVISGFLITRNIAGALTVGTFSIGDFYSRRIRRIFPALATVLLATYAIGWAVLFSDEFTQLGKHVAAGAAFVSNLVFQQESGYFDYSSDTKPLLHLWSLGIEEQFYIVWPLTLWALWASARRPAIIVAVMTAASVIACILVTPRDQTAAFYSPFFRIWELTCGAWLALVPAPWARPAATPVVLLGLALIGATMFVPIDPAAFPGWWAILPVTGSCLVIAGGPKGPLSIAVLSNRLLVFVGLISYPLYLWHWPLLTFARILDGPLPSRSVRAVLVIVSVVLAWLTFAFIEQPLRRTARARASVYALTASMAVVAIAGVTAYSQDGLGFRPAARWAQPYVDSMRVSPRRAACIDIRDAHRRPDAWYCRLNPQGSASRVFVFGDSHGVSLLPAFEQVAIDQGRDMLITGFSGCPPLLGIDSVRADQEARNCRALNERVLAYVSEQKFTDVVLVGAWSYYTDGDYSGENVNLLTTGSTALSLAGSRQAFEQGVAETLSRYAAAGVRVHVVEKVPSQLGVAPDLIRSVAISNDDPAEVIRRVSVPHAEHRRLMQYVSSVFERQGLRGGAQGAASLIELDAVYCEGGVCPFGRPGTSYYMDNNHLTVAGALLAAPVIARRLAND